MLEKLHLFYTNDLHSNFTQWPRVAGYFNKKREQLDKLGETYWLADIGDHMDRVHPISEAFMGRANVSLLNEAGYDFATIGNNEGITLAHGDLFHLYDHADFQVVCANMNGSVLPEWLNATTITTTANGTRIGIIGLTAPFNDYYDLLGWHMDDPWEMLDAYLPVLEQQTDIIVVLSHLGISEDREMARRFPDIDVIIGGHTHHLLKRGEHENNAIITAAGKHCFYVGEVILTWDTEGNKLVSREAYATDVTEFPPDAKTAERIAELEEMANEKLEDKLTYLQFPLEVDWFKQTEIIQSLTDTLLDWTNADCAMLNAGLLLDSLPAGEISYKDVHRICPHPINPCVVELTGSELLEVVRVTQTDEFMHFQLKGFGFRGKVLGKMMFSGLEVIKEMHPNGQSFVKEVNIDDQQLDMDRNYHVATADAFTFGRMLPEVAKSSIKRYFVPEFLRDLLAATLKQKFTTESKK
ncbi:bifunctional UDP-sugar hydrolase/5'-nucleotidase [Virgibacillus sp. 179-BFC.A HS]|uniref:Bifunctional UDP-sugar hydrolase/5'-nucleotidase n=1 Tax=Tigheibacillus jepli TaxID=3035914 RepID=A0ABU5CHD8_9BACI|nr:bifunctional UDP-sugar hydrolase/5'-nucleotidase [Virgibacillus sp. 179-BFC.A HS]MDY0405224.1 bifunctional UDP-sugar hydrolase/5'-nucleotidase [Virgibacillus sp. 179-BFC.A HS]